jgi:hypothetical protein
MCTVNTVGYGKDSPAGRVHVLTRYSVHSSAVVVHCMFLWMITGYHRMTTTNERLQVTIIPTTDKTSLFYTEYFFLKSGSFTFFSRCKMNLACEWWYISSDGWTCYLGDFAQLRIANNFWIMLVILINIMKKERKNTFRGVSDVKGNVWKLVAEYNILPLMLFENNVLKPRLLTR